MDCIILHSQIRDPKEGSVVKKTRLAVSLVVIGIILVAGSAMAAQVTTVGGSGYGPYQNTATGGGEFTLQASTDLTWVLNGYAEGKTKNVTVIANTFQTFCLEHTEYISPNTVYNVSISSTAKNGGAGAISGVGDAISVGTAQLYSQFAAGTLDGYNYSSRSTSSADLQNAIWMLEDEITWDGSNRFIKAMVDAGSSETALKADANGAYGVGVLNLGNPGQGQDQLVMAGVPEPSALLLLGICLVGAAIAVKKFNIQI
jgi:hypothetical protein